MDAPAPHTREARIDALKGFAIICVVTYHALGQYYSYTPVAGVVYFTWAVYLRAFLFSFMLPLFAFLSGYVLGRPGGFRPREYFRKRTIGLLVPYLMWEGYYGPSRHPEMLGSVRGFVGYFAHVLQNPHYEGRMWYLLLLWMALMIIGLLRLTGDRTWLMAASIPVVWVVATTSPYWWLRWLYLFVCAGVLFRRYEPRIKPSLRWLGIGGAVAFVPLWLIAEPEPIAAARLVSLVHTQAGLTLGHVALALLPVLVGICAVIAIYAASFHIPPRLEAPLAYLGTLSLGIYLTHFPFVEMWNGMPWWFLPINVVIATVVAVGWTLVIGHFRVTATLLLGEPWVKRPRELGDVETETL